MIERLRKLFVGLMNLVESRNLKELKFGATPWGISSSNGISEIFTFRLYLVIQFTFDLYF